jgi:hypothetical protein
MFFPSCAFGARTCSATVGDIVIIVLGHQRPYVVPVRGVRHIRRVAHFPVRVPAARYPFEKDDRIRVEARIASVKRSAKGFRHSLAKSILPPGSRTK